MSTLLYGNLSRKRLDTSPGQILVTATATDLAAPVEDEGTSQVSLWQDALAALVPVEVLGLHAVAMSYGTTTKRSGATVDTTITYPDEMRAVYIAMMALTAALYFVTAKSFRPSDWARAAVPVAAFVMWTMIQPSTAFDAFEFNLNPFARVMIAVIGAVVLGGVTTLLGTQANQSKRKKN